MERMMARQSASLVPGSYSVFPSPPRTGAIEASLSKWSARGFRVRATIRSGFAAATFSYSKASAQMSIFSVSAT
jgi:hypothetical protein